MGLTQLDLDCCSIDESFNASGSYYRQFRKGKIRYQSTALQDQFWSNCDWVSPGFDLIIKLYKINTVNCKRYNSVWTFHFVALVLTSTSNDAFHPSCTKSLKHVPRRLLMILNSQVCPRKWQFETTIYEWFCKCSESTRCILPHFSKRRQMSITRCHIEILYLHTAISSLHTNQHITIWGYHQSCTQHCPSRW